MTFTYTQRPLFRAGHPPILQRIPVNDDCAPLEFCEFAAIYGIAVTNEHGQPISQQQFEADFNASTIDAAFEMAPEIIKKAMSAKIAEATTPKLAVPSTMHNGKGGMGGRFSGLKITP